MIVPSHPPTGKSPAIAPVFRHFSGSDCASSQLQSIANVFFHGQQQYDNNNNNNNNEEEESTTALSILVVGPEGSGKTHLLDSIEQQCRFAGVDIDIIHPVLPFDAIGTTAGAAEDILISMICYAKTHEKNCLLLLDDIDSICGQTEHSTSATANGIVSSEGQREPHLTARLRNLFLSLLDMIQKRDYYYESRNGGRMMLICSSRENFGRHIDRFDRILPLLPPNEEERRRILSDYDARGAEEGGGGDGGGDSGGDDGDDSDDSDGDGGDSSSSIDNLVDCTLGFSRAEIAHHCRQALSALLHSRLRWTDAERGTGPGTNNSHDYDYNYDYNFASYLREKLQSSTPESLKNGANADFVDMRVFSARDLQKLHPIRNPENPVDDLPLFGESARTAWQELRRLIVLPVCRGSALDNILYHRGGNGSNNNNNNNNKTFAGGVLLAASPGTGKSTLAYFGAAVAASINPSINLIDVGCTSLIHKEVGGSEKALHRLFRSARSATPCIVVMDGIENIAAVRGNDTTTEGTMDRVLSTLLTELDGAESESNNHGGGGGSGGGGMAVIGITHNPEWIDPALRRPGRLERTIWLDNPDREGRKSIVAKEFGTAVYQPDDVHPELRTLDDLAARVANETEGCTGAEVIAICNESKLSAFNRFFQDKSSSNNSNNEKSDCITPQVVLEAVGTRRSNSGQ